MEKFQEYLEKAEKIIKTAEHWIYVTFPLIKDKKLLLKVISEINLAVLNIINSILHYEYLYKRIKLTKKAQENLETFIQKCAPRYEITQSEIKTILELLKIAEQHRKSSMEFVKGDKIVILSEDMKKTIITLEQTKEFLRNSKKILEKTKKVYKT